MIFILVKEVSEDLSGGNIYNREVVSHLNKIGVESEIISIYDSKWKNDKTATLIIDSIAVDENFDLNEFENHRCYFLVHLWPHLNENNEGIISKIEITEQNIISRMPLILAGIESKNQFELKYTDKHIVQYKIIPPGVINTWKAKSEWPTIPVNLLNIGNFHERKNQIELIATLAEFKNKNWKLNIYGEVCDNNYFKKLKKAINENDLEDRVKLNNPKAYVQMNELYNEHDLLISVSHFENNSMALIEACASKLPFISSKTGNWAEYKDQGVGLIYDKNLKEILNEVFINENRYKSLIENMNKQRINTWNEVAAMYRDMILN